MAILRQRAGAEIARRLAWDSPPISNPALKLLTDRSMTFSRTSNSEKNSPTFTAVPAGFFRTWCHRICMLDHFADFLKCSCELLKPRHLGSHKPALKKHTMKTAKFLHVGALALGFVAATMQGVRAETAQLRIAQQIRDRLSPAHRRERTRLDRGRSQGAWHHAAEDRMAAALGRRIDERSTDFRRAGFRDRRHHADDPDLGQDANHRQDHRRRRLGIDGQYPDHQQSEHQDTGRLHREGPHRAAVSQGRLPADRAADGGRQGVRQIRQARRAHRQHAASGRNGADPVGSLRDHSTLHLAAVLATATRQRQECTRC